MIDLIQEIFSTLKHNKLRTFLTGFAVAWGIFMLIVLLGFGNGTINAAKMSFNEMTLNTVTASPKVTSKPYKGYKKGREIKFHDSDVTVAREHLADRLLEAAPKLDMGSKTMSRGPKSANLMLEAVYPSVEEIEKIKIDYGRFVNKTDIDDMRKVCTIQLQTAEHLFGRLSPRSIIGRQVKIDGLIYTIVGLQHDKMMQRPKCYIPYTTGQLLGRRGTECDQVVLSTKGLATVREFEKFEKDVHEVYSRAHDFAPDDNRAVWVFGRFIQAQKQNMALQIMVGGIWVIGIFTLLSGVVGVSNIMLITVKERTREFGIRKAIGAGPWDILKLVMAESIIITTFFGYIGLVAGIAATEYMNLVAGSKTMHAGVVDVLVFYNPTVSIGVAVQATLTLIVAGTLAGLFPARRAAGVKPIEALNAE